MSGKQKTNYTSTATIPMRNIGPIKINDDAEYEVEVPLATFESPLWPSTNRGAKISREIGGIQTTIISDHMTRSVVLEAKTAKEALSINQDIQKNFLELAEIVGNTSKFAQLNKIDTQIIGNLLFIRFSLKTYDAAGHNMVTKAADALINHLLKTYLQLEYVSISGNYCVDKKVSAVNGILGRGKNVIAEGIISKQICQQILKTTPEKIVNLHTKKNLLGSIIAGSLRSANAHFANMLLALYLATGQDAANIVEGSQGIVHAELKNNDLYFSVSVPNIIVGTIGNGKNYDFVRKNLEQMQCLDENSQFGYNSRKLATIVAATIWCGEISLLAAQTNQGELMRAHCNMERSGSLCYLNNS